MKICRAELRSMTPYSQSRLLVSKPNEKEEWQSFEERIWKERAHYDEQDRIVIPPMAFKMALDTAAMRLGLKIPGRRGATFTKHFLSGVLVMDPLLTQSTRSTVQGEWINANADGKRGSGKRVPRCYPVIPKWEGEVAFHVLDDTITKDVFERVLRESGQFVGIGRFRPQNAGFYGRFSIQNIEWEAQE